jgi:hypothetical protein
MNRKIRVMTPAQQAEEDAKRAEYLDREFIAAIEMVAAVWPAAVVTRAELSYFDNVVVASVSYDGEDILLRAPVEKVNLHVARIDARTWRRKQEELAALSPEQPGSLMLAQAARIRLDR